jgi:hypothetical protein
MSARPGASSTDPKTLPAYDDLPQALQGGRSAWGLFGSDDQTGLIGLMTPERIVAAARLIRKGAVFPLKAGAVGGRRGGGPQAAGV